MKADLTEQKHLEGKIPTHICRPNDREVIRSKTDLFSLNNFCAILKMNIHHYQNKFGSFLLVNWLLAFRGIILKFRCMKFIHFFRLEM